MIKFSSILENSNIIYLKHVQDHDNCIDSVYTYALGKNLEGDDWRKAHNKHSIDIIYSEIDAKHGDTIYLTIVFDDYEDFWIYPFKNVFDATGKALEIWRNRPKNQDYSIKVIEDIITTEVKITNQMFKTSLWLVYANCFPQEKEDFFNIAPELAKKDKIKNMLLSDRTITKFNL